MPHAACAACSGRSRRGISSATGGPGPALPSWAPSPAAGGGRTESGRSTCGGAAGVRRGGGGAEWRRGWEGRRGCGATQSRCTSAVAWTRAGRGRGAGGLHKAAELTEDEGPLAALRRTEHRLALAHLVRARVRVRVRVQCAPRSGGHVRAGRRAARAGEAAVVQAEVVEPMAAVAAAGGGGGGVAGQGPGWRRRRVELAEQYILWLDLLWLDLLWLYYAPAGRARRAARAAGRAGL